MAEPSKELTSLVSPRDPYGSWGDWNTDAARSALDNISGTWGTMEKRAPFSQSSRVGGQDIWRLGAGDWDKPGSYLGLTPQYNEQAGWYVPFSEHAKVSGYNPNSQDFFGKVGVPALMAAMTAGAAAGAGGGAELAAGGADLAGSLANPSSVQQFLSTVPEAVPGTQLPIGGSFLDITSPGALSAAQAAGNLIAPGMPSGLPGAAPAEGAATGQAPALPSATQAPAPVVDLTQPPTSLPQTPAQAAAPTATTTPSVTGSPVGGAAPGATPGVPGGVEVIEKGVPASAADKARLAPTGVQKALNALGLWNPAKGTLGANALPLAGLTASQIAASRSKNTLDKRLAEAGEGAKRASDQLLGQGLSGQPSAASAYEIDQWLKNTTESINQRYANMGRDPGRDSAAAREISDAKAKAVAMRDAAAQGLLTQGLNAAGIAQGPATQSAMAAAQQDQQFSSAVAQMLNTMAQLQAMQGRTAQ